MPTWLTVILEILKLTIPGLLVFLTTYYLLRRYLDGQYQLKLLEMKQSNSETSLGLRLQAYERLSLFCERISLPNLLLRVQHEGQTAASLRLTLLLAIQQEYDHNVTQQVYVSGQLWEIIKMGRDDVINSISLIAEKVDPKADGADLAQALINLIAQREVTGPEKAQEAVKKEVGLLFG